MNEFQAPPSSPPTNPEAGASTARAANNLYHTVVAGMSMKAGQNHFHETGDMGRAAAAGAGTFVRLNVWAYTFFAWWVVFLLRWDVNPGTTWFIRLLLVSVAPFAFGVTWVRNSDYALYNRRWFYRFWQPIATIPAIEKLPTLAIYAATWVVIGLAWWG